ncbi:class I SAM-dependent methyltransferase [Roseovarius indicus]|uniref:class I SAM-dependent methyltransferase n=1 Tax=Roseovarius indicus TaxID=540747 RepID=UPI0032EF053C
MIGSKLFWDKQAARYARSPIADEGAYAETLGRVRSYLHPSDRVLELGCGTGTTALKLADAVAHVTASDISGEMVRIGQEKAARQGVTNVDFLAAEPGDAALAKGGPHDVVMAFNLLHLIEDMPKALREMAKLVRPGGLFISKTFCRPGPGEANFEYRMTRLALPLMQLVGKAPHVAFMPIQTLESEIEAAGLKIIETGNYPARPPRRFVVASKPE